MPYKIIFVTHMVQKRCYGITNIYIHYIFLIFLLFELKNLYICAVKAYTRVVNNFLITKYIL